MPDEGIRGGLTDGDQATAAIKIQTIQIHSRG